MKTLADILAAQRENLTAQQTALTGILEKLPEAARAPMSALQTAVGEQLAALPQLEQAGDPDLMAYLGRMVEELKTQHGRLVESLTLRASVVAELDTLKGQITAGEYVSKAVADAAVEAARAAVRQELAGEIAAARKGVLETAGVPVPANEVLLLPANDFNARQQACVANVKTITERCAAPKARAALVSKLAWQTPEDVQRELDSLADLLQPAAATADPLLGQAGNLPAATPPRRLAVM